MAWVEDIEITEGEIRRQPTHVVAKVKTSSGLSHRPILQIDTFGSPERMKPGKQSQTLQFGEEVARKLYDLFKKTYGFN